MIEIMEISKKAENYDSVGAFYEKYNTAVAKSYEKYIEYGHHWCWCLVGNIVQEHAYIENYRMKKVYKPAVLKRICSSPYYWWGDTENDRKEIIQYLKTRAPEEAEKEMLKINSVNEKI